jgi:hypothetical protein
MEKIRYFIGCAYLLFAGFLVLAGVTTLMGPSAIKALYLNEFLEIFGIALKSIASTLRGFQDTQSLFFIAGGFTLFGTWAIFPIAKRIFMSTSDSIFLSSSEYFIKALQISGTISFFVTLFFIWVLPGLK